MVSTGAVQATVTKTSTENAYSVVCADTPTALYALSQHCVRMQAAYTLRLNSELEPVTSLQSGEYVHAECECVAYLKAGIAGRRLQTATGTSITYNFYLITTSPARQAILVDAASKIKTTGPEWTNSALYTEMYTVASTDSGSVVEIGVPYTTQVPHFDVPPSPPTPPPPPCNAQCDTYTDGASALTATVCVHVGMGSAATTCRPSYSGCDSGALTCTQDPCSLKKDKKGKWRKTKCAKKVGKCDKKKKVKKKCKKTCCQAGY